ncbi:energy transducer TonB [Brevundimonas sp. NIBR10]|uniref:energy transducer TonB family protein n=1 Tax=Brevundimonas sp. NIBR10 TaxID=3015997 RepID=UPI0022F1CDFF|nr:energy transducer TonB [Brevundimonas sp. NIBR10]
MNVRCKDDRLEVYLVIVGYLGDAADVRYRFDNGEVRTNTWDTSTDGSGVFAPGPGEFARSLMTSSRLVFEVTGEYGSPDQIAVSLAGSSGPIGRVLDGCGVPRSEIYRPDGPIWRRAVEAIDAADRDTIELVSGFLAASDLYDGSPGRTRPVGLYQALSDFYSGYWSMCRSGRSLSQSCDTWTASRRYNNDADYPKEPIELLAEIVSAPPAPETPAVASTTPAVLTNVTWSRPPRVTADDFPSRALDRGVGGFATVSCTAAATGRPANCRVVSESPAGLGFGQAAVRVVQRAQLSPRSSGTIADPTFTTRVEFNVPTPAAP